MHKKANNFGKLAALALIALPTSCLAAIPDGLAGTVKIDGSSTVYPITEAVAEEFGKVAGNVKVTVGISCTCVCIKKFFAC